MKQFLKSLFFLVVIIGFNSSIFAQDYIGSEFLRKYDPSYFFNEFGLTVNNGVELYKINYTTVDLEGKLDTASGMVAIPDKNTYTYSVVAYHHGTVGSRYDVPSEGSYEVLIPSIYAAFGFISIAPDYIGLGDSRGFHPYIHAASEAWATRDMLIAAEQFYTEKNLTFKRRLFLSGYSQGGHASMAAQRLIESEPSLGFDVVAATHMSGPYDISSTMKSLLLSQEEYPLVAYMPNVALSFDEVYGIFNGDINNFFLPNYSTIILRFYREEIDLWTLNDLLITELKREFGTAIPSKMLIPQMLSEIASDENHPVNIALRDNDVYDWTPIADTKLFYCGKDEQVAFQNSLTAEAKMKENGAKKVQAYNIDNNQDHTGCVIPAVTNSVFFFASLLQLTDTENIAFEDGLAVYPNPVNNSDISIVGLQLNEEYNITIYNSNGMLVNSINKLKNKDAIDVSNLSSGVFTVRIENRHGGSKICRFVKM